ncbi:MAG: DUF896 domain-containing protein [Clostridia bacterium]|nr:DUF896 domain-containing protein [Clostridia bacterium]MBP3555338.1 DUF896 domain-containing protein [Clostridia bacterium]MBQ8420239.1 DUF896 domain-containing protein [Clostridia bacterium]
MSVRTDRINELYHKSKTVGLTEEEKAEQKKLRDEFRAIIRANMSLDLNNTVIERPDGQREKLTKKGK